MSETTPMPQGEPFTQTPHRIRDKHAMNPRTARGLEFLLAALQAFHGLSRADALDHGPALLVVAPELLHVALEGMHRLDEISLEVHLSERSEVYAYADPSASVSDRVSVCDLLQFLFVTSFWDLNAFKVLDLPCTL